MVRDFSHSRSFAVIRLGVSIKFGEFGQIESQRNNSHLFLIGYPVGNANIFFLLLADNDDSIS